MSPNMAERWEVIRDWNISFMMLVGQNVQRLVETEPGPLDVLEPETAEAVFDELLQGVIAGKALMDVLQTLARDDLTAEQQVLANDLITSIHKHVVEGNAETS